MAMKEFDPEDPASMKRLRALIRPQLARQIRQTIQICWMSLPPSRQNVEQVEKQVRRIMERTLRDLRKDPKSFDLGHC